MTALSSLSDLGGAAAVTDGAAVAPITRAEARTLAVAEYERFLAMVESLGPDDWAKPTACTAWNVHQMLAHKAGAYAGWASLREFVRQVSARPAAGQLVEDALSARQVADRAGRTPAELMVELKASAMRAIANQARLPRLVRRLGFPHPVSGFLRLGHLLDEIYTRDTWMHRLDIARATGRPMALSPEHDGRLVALVMRDLAGMLGPKLDGQSVVFELTGPAGGAWRVGEAAVPAASICMDALDFNILASGRYTPEEGLARATLDGDRALAERALRASQALF